MHSHLWNEENKGNYHMQSVMMRTLSELLCIYLYIYIIYTNTYLFVNIDEYIQINIHTFIYIHTHMFVCLYIFLRPWSSVS